MKKRSGVIRWIFLDAAVMLLVLVSAGYPPGESAELSSPKAMPGAGVVTVVSPDGPLPVVVASENEEEYYGKRVKAHQDAAVDLCDYLSRVTGRDIKPGLDNPEAKVIIHVGPDDFVLKYAPEVKGLFADGFLLKQITVKGKEHLILSGIRSMSSRWAVEEFLEQFAGVRWLFPGDAKYGEIVPSRPTITVNAGLDQKHEPDYIARSNCSMHYYTPSGGYLRLRPSESWGFGSHEIAFIFTHEDYEAHPEWFALFTAPDSDLIRFKPEAAGKGLRQRWHWDYGNGWQICMSNPETVRHAVEYARDYFAKNPDSPVVSMGHNDGDGWCECDLCRKFAASANPPYTTSERYWYWVNQVAKELAKTHPDKMITTIAYGTPATPPRFPLEKNVSVTVTVYVEGHLDLVKRWKEKCGSVNLYTYAYGFFFLGFRHYPHAMRDFLKWGHDELGAASLVAEISGDWSFDGPKYHYMQALMWDVNADPDKIMQDYCHDWFGAAAGEMKVFWDRLEEVYERRGHPRRLLFYQWLGWNESYDELDLYTLDDVATLDKAIAAAERKADTDGDRYRLARVADAWKYYRTFLLGKMQYADKQDTVLAEAAKSSARALELARELAELQSQKASFFRLLRAYPQIREPRPQQDLKERALQLVAFNPQAPREWYLSTFTYVSFFSDMRTILDDLCEQATGQLIKTTSKDKSLIFWEQVKRDDPLYESAQTQIYLLQHPDRGNILVNNDFETGNLEGWQVSGDISVTAGTARTGNYAAQAKGTGIVTLSQSIPVKPGERYRLTVRGKYPTKPNPNAFLFTTDVTFTGSGKPRYEPNYRRLRTINPEADGWVALHTTFTVPEPSEKAVILLRASGGPLFLDDLKMEKIQAGPVIKSGVVLDDFSGNHLDENNWMEASAGRSGFLPAVKDGALVFDQRPMATLVSWSSFNELLNGAGEGRYRLRLHISKGDEKEDGLLEVGIKTDTLSLTTENSGLYFVHSFYSSGERKDRVLSLSPSIMLKTYWHQDGRFVGGGNFDIKPNDNLKEVWYTFYFDKGSVSVYAGTTGYDESEGALVGTYKHNMANIASKGPVFLQITGNNVRVEGISLMRPGAAAGNQ